MVADDTPRPLSFASTWDDTGSPVSMYSRTSVASSRRDRSERSKELISGQNVASRPLDYSPLPDAGRRPLLLQRAFPSHADRGNIGLGHLAVLHGDEFRQDADRNFLRGDRTDIQADR